MASEYEVIFEKLGLKITHRVQGSIIPTPQDQVGDTRLQRTLDATLAAKAAPDQQSAQAQPRVGGDGFTPQDKGTGPFGFGLGGDSTTLIAPIIITNCPLHSSDNDQLKDSSEMKKQES